MRNTTHGARGQIATLTVVSCLVSGWTQIAFATLIVNPAQPITHQVTVQPIVVSNDNGSDTAEFFGNASQEAEIKSFIDTIWAQVGIDIDWLAVTPWNDTFANNGTPGNNNPRPSSDLNATVTAGNNDNVTTSGAINIFFVEIAAGFSQLANNQVAGLAFIDASGISQFVGDDLPGDLGGREIVASVVAHEIGHNLGLPHITESQNLMQQSGASNQGERINTPQGATARNSQFAQIIPEPSTYVLAIVGAVFLVSLARRRKRLRIAA